MKIKWNCDNETTRINSGCRHELTWDGENVPSKLECPECGMIYMKSALESLQEGILQGYREGEIK